MRELDKALRVQFAASLVGTTQEVFMEERKDGLPHGITGNFQQVILEGVSSSLSGVVRVRITRSEGPLCFAEVL